jgi:hypothetical protein
MWKLDKKAFASPHGCVGVFAKATLVLLLTFLATALLLVVPASAQAVGTSGVKPGSISGTVVDLNSQPIPDATVVLQGPVATDRRTAVTKDDGVFVFRDVTPGTPYQITTTAEGFGEWSSSVTVAPGQTESLAAIKLRILAAHRSVTVGYSPQEVAKQQLKAEEQQRILKFIPNFYVTYEKHPEPLTTNMKFHLAYKSLTDPIFFARAAVWAGIRQAANTPDYGQGTEGYAKRFGAGTADAAVEDLVGNAILPSLLHQDPRYFYQGDGTKKSRAWHAIRAPFVTPADNGKMQPNYSTWGGLLAASAISLAYVPDSNRNAGYVFKSFGVGMGLHVGIGVAQEFILKKFTSRGKHANDH